MNHSKENKQEHQHMMHSEEVGQTSHHSHQQEHPHEEGGTPIIILTITSIMKEALTSVTILMMLTIITMTMT
ncbi:hypothetical protein P7J12_07985 [Streptococcus suis]|uniref:hypothetical protein n=1 Tax=Streptococcus suis TaxID=1307 RepID=UPI0038B7A173